MHGGSGKSYKKVYYFFSFRDLVNIPVEKIFSNFMERQAPYSVLLKEKCAITKDLMNSFAINESCPILKLLNKKHVGINDTGKPKYV